MEANKKSLQVTIESVEFEAEFNYFLTIQMLGEPEKVFTKSCTISPLSAEQTYQLV